MQHRWRRKVWETLMEITLRFSQNERVNKTNIRLYKYVAKQIVPSLHLLRMLSLFSRIFLSLAGPAGRFAAPPPRCIILFSSLIVSTHLCPSFCKQLFAHSHLKIQLFYRPVNTQILHLQFHPDDSYFFIFSSIPKNVFDLKKKKRRFVGCLAKLLVKGGVFNC